MLGPFRVSDEQLGIGDSELMRRRIASAWKIEDSLILPAGLECEFYLKDGASFVPDLNRHPVDLTTHIFWTADRIPGHIRQGSRGLFLYSCDVP